MSGDAPDVLMLSLMVAVPLRIAELGPLPPKIRFWRMRTWAAASVDDVTSRGDILMYRHPKARGDTAQVFNNLARGLAALACCPGGVCFAGMHWCLDEHSMGRAGTHWETTTRPSREVKRRRR